MRREHLADFDRILNKIPSDTLDLITVTPLVMSEAALRECEVLRYDAHFKPEICFRLYYFEMSRLSGDAAYLDIDTIVRTSLEDLSKAIPQGAPMAARAHDTAEAPVSLMDHGIDRYFNSGIMLFNVSGMEGEIVDRLRSSRSILKDIHGKSNFLDQDALNMAFNGRWKMLPPRFNYMSTDYSALDRNQGYILHATGSRKPWMLGGRHRFSDEYAEEMTAMRQSVLQRYEAKWIVDRVTRRITNFFGHK